MELILGYGAGLLTLINPCVLPVLPIVLASAMQAGRWGPVALVSGMAVSFVALGLAVATLGRASGLTPELVSQVGAVLMIGFGLMLLVPRFSAGFATATAGMAAAADTRMDDIDRSSLRAQGLGGVLLGAVWSPCIGPTLGAAISLASQGESLVRAGAIMTAFSLGVATIMLALAYGARAAIRGRQEKLRTLAGSARPILGGVFVLVGVGILFNVHHAIDAWALDHMPIWLQDLSVAL